MEDCRVFAIQLLNVFGKSNERVNENAFANIGNVKAFFFKCASVFVSSSRSLGLYGSILSQNNTK